MKKTPVLLLLVIAFLQPDFIVAKAKHNCPELSHSAEGKYQFDEFKDGKVHFKNGKFTKAKLNYNYLLGAIEFISNGKDTLIITNKSRVDYIALNESIFYSQEGQGDMELVAEFGTVLLAKKTHLVIKGSKANSSEQKYISNPESVTPTSLLISNQTGEFRWQNTTAKPEYKYKTDYFLIDQNRLFHLAKKSNFMKIYGKHRSALSDYFRKNDVDFNNQDALRSLLRYCSSL
ncbi:hypothetical protein SAMN04487995_1975 [Dyadobacter koreensis]|uniref:Uncharacterized protein n=1 Tax=Dyadobacter koreensis TaxID=408657 RepID=A0A1H6T2F6_9BACT|nr:hypothetical protein [Dyadobacter koreensis]SEI74231.1 hypothetical protein SAMN04487995_1975 [Dyadobacter koreensis]